MSNEYYDRLYNDFVLILILVSVSDMLGQMKYIEKDKDQIFVQRDSRIFPFISNKPQRYPGMASPIPEKAKSIWEMIYKKLPLPNLNIDFMNKIKTSSYPTNYYEQDEMEWTPAHVLRSDEMDWTPAKKEVIKPMEYFMNDPRYEHLMDWTILPNR